MALEIRGCDIIYNSFENEYNPPLEFINNVKIYSIITAYNFKPVKKALLTSYAKEWTEVIFAEIR